MVGHLLWYHPAVLKLKELIDEGELGPYPIYLFEPPQPREDPPGREYFVVFCPA